MRALDGTLDLSHVDLQQEAFSLQGQWRFYPNVLIDSYDYIRSPGSVKIPYSLQEIPHEWNGYKDENGKIHGGSGYGTYTLALSHIPKGYIAFYGREEGTAYSLFYCDEQMSAAQCRSPVISNGIPGTDVGNSIPQVLPVRNRILPHSDHGYLLMHVSNFHHRQGGFWENILFGSEGSIIRNQEYNKALGYISLGVILIMGIYHLGLFGQRREDRGSLYFGLFCLDLSMRIFFTERIPHALVTGPSVQSFEWFYRGEYLSLYLAAALFYQFVYNVFRDFFSRYVLLVTWAVTLGFSSLLVFPVAFYSQYLIYFLIFMLIGAVYVVIGLIRAGIHHVSGSGISLFGYVMFVLAALNDIAYSQGFIQSAYVVQYGFLFFIFSQSMILSTRFSLAFRESEAYRTSLARFVPSQFVNFLDKKSILEVFPGDGVKRDLTVLFLDIRGFTTLSEAMTTEENFRFLNSFLRRMNPYIHANRGFVDKFIGDAIMALFPEGAENAIHAAILMQKELITYNEHRARLGYVPVQMGIGIHTGELMLGTVGDVDRLDTTVIGDTVNLASRLENLTKTYHSEIIVSEKVIQSISPDRFHIREIDTVPIKGKKDNLLIYEIFDADPIDRIEKKEQTAGVLKQGIELYRLARYEEAMENFERCLRMIPDDRLPAYYMDRCLQNRSRV